MICSYCGKEITDDSVFCAYCGKETAAPAEEAVTEETVLSAEEAVTEETVLSAEEDTPSVAEEPRAPKKRRFPLKWLIAAVVAVVAVGALLLNMSTIVGTVIRTFGSDTDYYRYAELKSVKREADTAVDYYALFKDALVKSAYNKEGSIRPVLGEDAKELLEEIPLALEWDWLNDLTISYKSNYKDDVLGLELGIAVAEGDPLKIVGFMDAAQRKLFAGLPKASDTYLQWNMNTDEENEDWIEPPSLVANVFLDKMTTDPRFAEDLQEALPSGKTVNKLIDRYFTLVLDMVSVSASEKTTLTVGDIVQECTKTTVKVTQKQYVDIVNAVLNAAKTDKDIENILADMQVFLQKNPLDEEIDLRAKYVEAIDEMLAEVKAEAHRATDETLFTVITYIDKQHEVIGRHITAADADWYCATARKGNAFATELSSGDEMRVSGNGTLKGDVVSGEFELAVDGSTLATVSVTDFDTGRAKDGYLNGTFRLEPKKALFEMMGMGEDTALLYLSYDPSLELVAKTSKNESKMALNLYKDESLFAGFVFEEEKGKAETVTLPEKTVDATDEEALEQWWNAVEGDTLEEKLQTVGVPADILKLLGLFIPTLA